MKFNIKYITFSALLCASMVSCDLDVVPPSDISTETFWKNEKDAWNGLNALYAELPGMDIWDEMYTDNAHSHKPWEGPYELVQTNGITAGNDFGYGYSTVRIANNFIINVDKCDISEGLKERMKAEARFFRAWQYLQLTTKFGKAYLFTDVPEYNAPYAKRDPAEKVQAFILSELNEIAEILPDEYDGSYLYESSRITRAAALALRARAALYFGNYIEAEASAGKVISEGHHSLFRVTSLNAAQQQEADEMEKYIDFAEVGIDKDKFVKGLFSYETLWHKENANPGNPEYILTREYMADDNNCDWTRYTYIRPSQMGSGYSSFEPMQDLVDAYWSIDGKTLPEIPSEETRRARFADMWMKYFAEPVGETYKSVAPAVFREKVPTLDIKSIPYMQEFRNRDSRLYASILFPLKGWQETDFSGDFYYMWDPLKAGSDGNESWTGYNYRKLVSLTPYQGWQSVEDYPIIRYAEVLLNYAEAKAELGELTDADWAATIGALRSRAGITGGTPQTGTLTTRPSSAEPYIASYYPTISDPSLLEIRRERGIELCLEGLRLNDLKRWNCCDLWVNDPWEGIFIPSLNQPLDVNGDGNYDAYFYDTDKIADEKYAAIGVYVGTNKSNVLNVKPVQGGYLMEYNYAGRSWPARQYLYPIPEVVIQFNTNLSQNPGW